MNLISIPAFQDNYIWLLDDRQGAALSSIRVRRSRCWKRCSACS